MKQLIKRLLYSLGYEVRRIESPFIGSVSRPIGNMKMLLEDLRRRGLNPKSILDVGANCGNWSQLARQVFPQSNFFLIEPQIEMESSLAAFCNESPGSRYFLAGVGSAPNELVLTIWDDLAGSSFLPKQSGILQKADKQRIVPVTTIDSLIKEKQISIPQIVKLDVQGFELKALQGGTKLFDHTEAFILEVSLFKFMEEQPLFDEVIHFMKERNFCVYDFPGFLRRPYDGALGQCDICFVPHDGFLRRSNNWI